MLSDPVRSSPERFASTRSVYRALAVFAAVVACSAGLPGTLSAQVPASRTALTPEEIAQGYSNRTLLAKPRAAATPEVLAATEARERVQFQRRLGTREHLRVLQAMEGESVTDALERLRASGQYEYVELDHIVKAAATPNDPRFLAGEQWGLRNTGQDNGTVGADIGAVEAWDIQSGAPNVIVAVIDSGIRHTHQDLLASLWRNPGESGAAGSDRVDSDGNGYVDDIFGINSTVPAQASNSGSPADVEGHGTAVASVIAAAGNNGVGMTGVAWSAKLMALRFMDSDGYGLISDEIECIDYAIAKGAHLMNMSFGSYAYSQSLYDALKRARDAGIIAVCAAGNAGEDSDLIPSYPAGYLLDNIVAVTNTTRTDILSSAASYGSGSVELGAPGSSILVASAGSDSGYFTASGTSLSTPMVTGALALIKAKFPGDNHRQLINRLLRGATKKAALEGKTITGARLNVAGALRTTTNRPFNDDFASRALFVGETATSRSASQHATREENEPVHAGTAGNGSLWWSWTATRSGSVTFETTGSAFDTLLAVYTGNSLASLTAVASNDDQSGSLNTSKVSFNAVAGTTYQLAVDTKGTTFGVVGLKVTLLASNDNFASAQAVTGLSWSMKGDNRAATRETDEPRIRNNAGGASMWYKWTAPASRRYHLATFSTEFNTMMAVYTGTAIGSLNEVTSATTGGDSNSTILDAAVTLQATKGTTYYISVDTEISASGTSTKGEFKLACIDAEWEFFGVGGFGTVAVSDEGTLHAADLYGYVYGLNNDGTRKWRHTMTGYGTTSSPAVATDGTVYIGDDLGYIHAISTTGTRKWRTYLQGAQIYASPAIAPDGTVYARAESISATTLSLEGKLVALNPSTGAIKWSAGIGMGSPSYASPVIAPDGTVYFPAHNRLMAYSPEGRQLWTYSTDFIYSSPAIAADGTIYIGVVKPTRRLIALKPDGTQKWDLVVGDTISSSPVIGTDGTIYFGCADKSVYAVTPAGTLKWTFPTGEAIHGAAPVVSSDGSIYAASLDGKVYCIESDGKLRRTYSTAYEIRSSPILHNGKLYITSGDYRLYAVEVGQVAASSAWPMHRQNARRTARNVPVSLGIGAQPKPATAEVSDIITFSVGATGTGNMSYQWLFNGQPIAGATSTTYRVDPVTHARAGQYSVRVTDSSGTVTSNAVTLAVSTPLVPPSVFTAPASQTALAGSSVTLSVTPAGTSPFTFQWLRDGQEIAGATNSSLAFNPARITDSGDYSVKITNFGGSITSPAAGLTVNPISRIANLSIRSQAGGSAGALAVGLTIGGAGTDGDKPLLVRAVGPTLAAFGVGGALADPRLTILSGTTTVGQNDDWSGNGEVTAASVAVGAFGLASATSKDAALAQAIPAGGYTVQINGAGIASGVALAEVYDTSPTDTFFTTTPRLINVSALTQVGTGGDVLIAGFSIAGVEPKKVLIRGIGPTLASFGMGGTLADPKLELFQSGIQTAMAANDNWGTSINATEIATAATNVGAFALATTSRDAVLLVTLPPGAYSAQVSGINNTTGAALVEVYEVP